MKNYIIAWRNLWRNRRRTLITAASVFFGVLLAIYMTSMQEGSYEKMIDNVVKFYSGYIQIQEEDYWEHKTLYYSFDTSDELYRTIDSVDLVTQVIPRLESFALVSSFDITQPAAVIGIDPLVEDQMTGLSRWVKEGNYFGNNPHSILLAETLAKNLDVEINDTIALLSQGYYGNTVAAEFVVTGILSFPNPELNKGYAYLNLERAQKFFSAEGKLTSLSLMLKDYSVLEEAKTGLEKKLDSPFRVLTWEEMQPELVQMIESDRAGGVIMKAILYIIIGFGILGTVMMMIAERRKELGLMVAVGMQKYKLAGILFYETLYIGLIGVFCGIVVSIPIIAWFIHHPIQMSGDAAQAMLDMGIEPLMYFSAELNVFVNQLFTVFILTMIVSLYPVISAMRLREIKWLRD